MSTPSTDVTSGFSCLLCNQPLNHADVVLVGLDTNEVTIRVHPQCLGTERDKLLRELVQIEVHTEPGRPVSPAKQIVVKKRVKELYKALALANHVKRQATQ